MRRRDRLTLPSSDRRAPPLIFGQHLSEPADLAALRWGIEPAREIAAAAPFDAYRADECWPGPTSAALRTSSSTSEIR